MWTVYIIRSAEGLTYIGMTSNLQRRLKEHNSKESRLTKRGNNWTLFYSESHLPAKEARKREKYFKTTSGKEWLKRREII